MRDKVTIKTVSTKHNLFEEKGEPKRVSNRGPSQYLPASRLTARPNRLTRRKEKSCFDFQLLGLIQGGSGEHMDTGEGRGGVQRVVPPVIAKHTVDWYNQFRRAPSACDCNVHVSDTEVIQSHLPLCGIFRCAE